MTDLAPLINRIEIIELGYASPNHLTFNYYQTIAQTISSLSQREARINKLQIIELANKVENLLSDKILKKGYYRVIEYDGDFEEETAVVDSERDDYIEALLKKVKQKPTVRDQIEDRLRKELKHYQDAIKDLLERNLGANSRPKSTKVQNQGFMIDKFTGNYYLDDLINFKLPDQRPMFLNANEDREKIKAFLLTKDIDSFHERHYKIRFGIPLKYVLFFFEAIKGRVIVARYQSYIHKSQSFYLATGAEIIQSDHMRPKVKALSKELSAAKTYERKVTIQKNIDEIINYVKTSF